MQTKLLKPLILIVGLWQTGCDKEVPPAGVKPAVEHVKIEARRISVVYPKGASIPVEFINAPFSNSTVQMDGPALADCMIVEIPDATCDMAILDLNRDDKPEIVVLSGNELTIYEQVGSAYEWITRPSRTVDEKTITAFKAGQIFSHAQGYEDLGVGTKLIDISDEAVGEGSWKIAQAKAQKDTPPPPRQVKEE